MADPLSSLDPGSDPEESALLGLVDARGDAPWRVVGGISLTARLVRSLELLGIHQIVIAVDREPDPEALGSRQPATRLRVERLAPGAALSSATSPREVIAVDATLVVDRRLLAALVQTSTPTAVRPAPGSPQRVRLARLGARDLAVFGEPLEAASDLTLLEPSEISTYSEEMRGHDPILLFDASTPEGAKAAEDALVRGTQKHVMDAPARWIDPFFENAMLRGLAPTRVTPNHVTLAALVLGLLAAWWVWRGWLALALPAMFLVGWLDGVDGKLARLRLHYSRVGAGESFFDFAYENAWWFAFSALMVSSGHGDAAIWCGAALIGGNLLDEIAYTLSAMWLGTSLDLLTPADGAFRLIAGRRNVYVMILAVATVAGSTWSGFVVCGAWAVITGVAHGVRLCFALRARAHSESRA